VAPADGTACDDHDPCTTGDACTAGTCAGEGAGACGTFYAEGFEACPGGPHPPSRAQTTRWRSPWISRCEVGRTRWCVRANWPAYGAWLEAPTGVLRARWSGATGSWLREFLQRQTRQLRPLSTEHSAPATHRMSRYSGQTVSSPRSVAHPACAATITRVARIIHRRRAICGASYPSASPRGRRPERGP
jgi:hypothetical protein